MDQITFIRWIQTLDYVNATLAIRNLQKGVLLQVVFTVCSAALEEPNN